jgi:hypothetical protein
LLSAMRHFEKMDSPVKPGNDVMEARTVPIATVRRIHCPRSTQEATARENMD